VKLFSKEAVTISEYSSNDSINSGVIKGRGVAGGFCGLIYSIIPISVLRD
jgi:hypothetical protein